MSINRVNEIKEQLGYLTDDGRYWLQMDIANTFGYDKLSFNDRIDKACSLYEEYLNTGEFMHADSPWEFKNACEAMGQNAMNKPVEHMVYLDCTNQALQLYAVVTSCKDTGYLCNVSSGDVLTDAYGEVAKAMNRLTSMDIFNRDNCKKALMTTLYGKMDGHSEIIGYFQDNGETFPSSLDEEELGKVFHKAMNEIAPNAMRAMDVLQSLNDENVDVYYWTMPDGFRVKYDVKSSFELDISAETTSGVKFNIHKDIAIYKGSKYNRGIAPNVIHSIDGYVAREMVRRMTNPNLEYNRSYPAFITTIHDAFATHPNNAEEMRSHYTDILCELNDSNILQDIMSQIKGQKVLSIKKNTLTNQMIKESLYSLS